MGTNQENRVVKSSNVNSILLCKDFEDFCNRRRLTPGVQAAASSPQHLLLRLHLQCQGFLRNAQVHRCGAYLIIFQSASHFCHDNNVGWTHYNTSANDFKSVV